MINWQFFPKSIEAPEVARGIVSCFKNVIEHIDSTKFELQSNDVLRHVCPGLQAMGFEVETGKKNSEKIHVPVLFGLNGATEKSFEADAYSVKDGFVLEVEAGRAVVNNQFLKDLFQACMMNNVQYLGIAVRNIYKTSKDFERVMRFLDTLYASNRLKLPLKGILVIGY